jgi:pimeloyl-ACP methyl ester carboxylesterase
MIGIVNVLGYKVAAVVGHDWGATVAWHVGRHVSKVPKSGFSISAIIVRPL